MLKSKVVETDGAVTIVLDAKQLTSSGAIKLDPNAAGGNTQMSEAWILRVLDALPDSSPAKIAILNARSNNSLTTAVGGVNKATGNVVVLPAKVPSGAVTRP